VIGAPTVKSEPKAFASLSSGLLARKGAARPAMRPQGFGQMGAAGLDDLGWNDMGFEAPKAAAAPVRDADHDAFGNAVGEPALRNPVGGLTPFSPVHAAQAEIAERFVRDAQAASEDDLDETAETMDLAEPVLQAVAAAVLSIPAKASIQFDHPAEDEPVKLAAVEALAEPEQGAEPSLEALAEHPAEMPAIAGQPAPVRRPAEAKAPRPVARAGGRAKAAFTLRLEPERHLKLRLACAVTARSAQQLVTQALDAWLAAMPELDAMARSAPDRAAPAQKD
jgi:hypothetical protein